MHTPGQGTFFFVINIFKELPSTEQLEFASASPGHQTPSSAWWSDRALRRDSGSGVSPTGPVSRRAAAPPSFRRVSEPTSRRARERQENEPICTLHLRLPDGRPVLFWVLVLVGACQSGTVWAGLCPIHHHHQENEPTSSPAPDPMTIPDSRRRTAARMRCPDAAVFRLPPPLVARPLTALGHSQWPEPPRFSDATASSPAAVD